MVPDLQPLGESTDRHRAPTFEPLELEQDGVLLRLHARRARGLLAPTEEAPQLIPQVGEPRALVDGLIEQGAKDLVVVHNTAGRFQEGVARLIGERRVRRIVCSFARSRGSVLFEEVFAAGQIELEIVPQGTLAERIRAGAAGIPAFFTATGAGTKLAEGKEARMFEGTFAGREYILEHAIRGALEGVSLAEMFSIPPETQRPPSDTTPHDAVAAPL